MKRLILALSIILTGCGSPQQETWFDYSHINTNSSGTLVSDSGELVSNWKRVVETSTSSKITWTDTEEYFYWDNQWIYLDKYKELNSNKEYPQFVTYQELCSNNTCNVISTSGKQKYAPINLNSNYTLDTLGYIIADSKQIQFRHLQAVTINVPCETQYYKNRVCLIQTERWWDDNNTPYQLKFYRNTWYAKGLGIGFIIESKVPTNYRAYLK